MGKDAKVRRPPPWSNNRTIGRGLRKGDRVRFISGYDGYPMKKGELGTIVLIVESEMLGMIVDVEWDRLGRHSVSAGDCIEKVGKRVKL